MAFALAPIFGVKPIKLGAEADWKWATQAFGGRAGAAYLNFSDGPKFSSSIWYGFLRQTRYTSKIVHFVAGKEDKSLDFGVPYGHFFQGSIFFKEET